MYGVKRNNDTLFNRYLLLMTIFLLEIDSEFIVVLDIVTTRNNYILMYMEGILVFHVIEFFILRMDSDKLL